MHYKSVLLAIRASLEGMPRDVQEAVEKKAESIRRIAKNEVGRLALSLVGAELAAKKEEETAAAGREDE